MNKWILGLVVVAVIGVSLGTFGMVNAQAPQPQSTPVPGNGYGHMDNRGSGLMMAGSEINRGLLHDAILDAFAEKLSLTVDELNTRLANGETMAEIATSEGLSIEEFQTTMEDIRNQAIEEAVQDGTLTREQADWLKQHGPGKANRGRGNTNGTGRFANPGCVCIQNQ